MYKTLFLILLFTYNASADPNALELLDKRQFKLENLQSFAITVEGQMEAATNHKIVKVKGKTTYSKQRNEVHYDGNRFSNRMHRWLNMDAPNKLLDKNSKYYHYNRELFDGNSIFTFASARNDPKIKNGILIKSDTGRISFSPNNSCLRECIGVLAGDNASIENILSKAQGKITVQKDMQKVGAWDCYVIDADTNYGKYQLWIDPAHGYNIAKAVVNKHPGNICDAAQNKKMTDNMSITSTVIITKFEQIDGLWIPVETKGSSGSTWAEGGYSKGSSHTKITSFKLNPDHEKLGSFNFDDIPDNTITIIVGSQNKYTWQNGHIIDSSGQIIDTNNPPKNNTTQKPKPNKTRKNNP